jgi:hypothetical protein
MLSHRVKLMRCESFLTASLLGAALAIPLATVASAAIVINIDKTRQQMSVSVDGTPRYLWPVSTRAAGLRHAERHLQGEPHGRRPPIPGME